jgi:antitoxin (DNA-binding transcriptional repressor) of toxin-antitoxin stability system
MKQVSATEAARRFSDVLDSVEGEGESFVVMRRGKAVARIGPARGGTGLALKKALQEHRADRDWAGELRELRQAVGSPPKHWQH